ncbi:MAG: Cu(I)/Ag(I) efflux system membrane fusion protein [Candidatus Marinamargulisbacteria bacterium]|jgi:Cu(I)/Ag(I) efflux system membrane fusion protein
MSQNKKKWMWIKVAGVLAVSLSLGVGIGNSFFHSAETTHAEMSMIQRWTCSMHPQIQKSKKGKCPICGMNLVSVAQESASASQRKVKYWQAPMDPTYKRNKPGKSPMGMALVPVYEEGEAPLGASRIRMSAHAEKLASVQVTPVVRAFATETLSLSGKLLVDETRAKTISAWFPGRIENLFIDYTGIRVNKQDHMAVIYSPDLLVAQKELIAANRSFSQPLAASSREKLRLWGFSSVQIREIEKTGKVSDQLTINAPIGGTVLRKFVSEGDYVKTGSKIYKMADLSRLWLSADVYEYDVGKVRYGQKLTFTTDAYPGRIFKGIVTFVDPVIDPKTRIVSVRAIVDNKDYKLKPRMLARVNIQIKMGANGVINPSDIKDLWVGPMHHEEVSTSPGDCSICGMKLKKASELGLATRSNDDKPLLIPATAPLITGKRAVVYVKGESPGVYEGREIMLGLRVGQQYIVAQGLKEGEQVVSKGNFKIDSAMQIMAKPSMMQNKTGTPMKGHNH